MAGADAAALLVSAPAGYQLPPHSSSSATAYAQTAGSVLFQQLIQISDMNLLNKTLKSDKVDFYVRGKLVVH